jgi:hypothetical protein
LIRHASREALEYTLNAVNALVAAWCSLGHDRVAAFNLAVTEGEREVCLGILGHVEDVQRWLAHPDPFPPPGADAQHRWIERVGEAMAAHGAAGNVPPLAAVITYGGTFAFERVTLPPSMFTPVASADGLQVGLRIPRADVELLDAVRTGALAVKPVYTYGSSTCSKCGAVYATCPHVRLVDAGVSQSLKDLAMLFVHWTDRPAQ